MFISCGQTTNNKNNYPNDLRISKADGTPKDTLTFFYPRTILKDAQTFETKIDSFSLKWFSSDLRAAKEPILFNYYLGHDTYRFLWLRSFHRPVVFTLSKTGNEITLTTKILDREAQNNDLGYDPREWKGKENIAEKQIIDALKGQKYKIEKLNDSLMIFKLVKKASIVLNDTKKLSEKEWNQFEAFLNDCSFWTLEPYERSDGLDGSEWTIEGHLANKYWFVNRWSPKDKFRKAGEFLINKSGLKEEIY